MHHSRAETSSPFSYPFVGLYVNMFLASRMGNHGFHLISREGFLVWNVWGDNEGAEN